MSDPTGPWESDQRHRRTDQAPPEQASFVGEADAFGEAASMDPAQKSLAEALRLLFFVIQGVLALLVVGFLASGFQTVDEAEQGIKLRFGRITSQGLTPGVQWSWPFPIGELVKVRTGQESLTLTDSFWPQLGQRRQQMSWSDLAGRTGQTLEPGEDGSLITADLNIAHTRWTVSYTRQDPAANVRNVYKPDEVEIVRSAVERGVVRSVAETRIDNLLRPSQSTTLGGGDEIVPAALTSRVERAAQRTLDELGAGIRIDDVILRDRNPPLQVFEEFNAVATAEQQADQKREEAEQTRRTTLANMAGEAHSILLDRIDAYGVALGPQGQGDPDQILEQIHRLLEGEPVEIDGRTYEGLVSGEASSILNAARRYRTNVVAEARSLAQAFNAKLEQFRGDRRVLMASDWRDAYETFLEQGAFEVMLLPPGSENLQFLINSDPEIRRRLERQRNRREAQENVERRLEEVRQQ